MDYAKEERIGNPDLFTGRKKELAYFLGWINEIKERKSQSTAMLARRKMGKTAIMERLFNITFFKNDGVIPFYYEIKEVKKWVGDFCVDFFLTFIYQYIAFKTRNIDSYAVSLLFSFKNTDHENRIREIIEEEHPGAYVSLSSEVLPEIREYERLSTTVINAMVMPIVIDYVADL